MRDQDPEPTQIETETDDELETALRPRRGRRWLKRLLVLALLAGAGVGAWQFSERWSTAAEGPKYVVAPVERGDVLDVVTASGSLSPVVQVEVGSQVSGRVKEVLVDFNDTVTQGQLLATIDTAVFESAVKQAEARLTASQADLARAQAQAASARTQYRRLAGLAGSGAVAQVEIDVARADQRAADAGVNSAQAAVTVAQGAVDEAQVNLAYTQITAPTDGVVVSVGIQAGQTVAASFSAPTLFVIAQDLRKMEVHTNVAESDVGRIVPGQAVEFTVDAYPDRSFPGTVRQVRYAAQTVSNVVTYDAVVTVANDDLVLRPGMTANVSFVVEARRGVLTVPQAAFRFRPAGAAATDRGVWVLRDNKPVAVAARSGLSDGSTAEVLGNGLHEGDQVVLSDGSAPSAASPAGAGAAAGAKRASGGGGGGHGGMGGRPGAVGLF